MKLALGTVQFGLKYGIANSSGRVTFEEANEILDLAQASGIDTLDTAVAYGDSERILGRLGIKKHWRVVSKLPALPNDCADVPSWVAEQTRGSLERLGLDRLYGLMLHRPEQLFAHNGAAYLATLHELKARGLVNKIGVSVYSPEELDRLFALSHFDIVQAPLNILDRRMVSSGWTRQLRNAGIELHIRSAFLQGLLLVQESQRDEKFNRWPMIWKTWSAWLRETGLSPLQACLAYVLSVEGVDKVVVGVDRVTQLQEILRESSAKIPFLPDWPEPIDPALINPALWSQL